MADNSFPHDQRTEDRSIPLPTANRVLSTLEACLGPLDVKVFMENHNATILHDLTHRFTLVDSGSDLDDLLDLAKNEVLVVAGSAYTTTAHQVSRGGLTVVPDTEEHQERYWSLVGTNSVLKWGEVSSEQDCAAVRKAFESGMKRSKRMLEEVGTLPMAKRGLAGAAASPRLSVGIDGQ